MRMYDVDATTDSSLLLLQAIAAKRPEIAHIAQLFPNRRAWRTAPEAYRTDGVLELITRVYAELVGVDVAALGLREPFAPLDQTELVRDPNLPPTRPGENMGPNPYREERPMTRAQRVAGILGRSLSDEEHARHSGVEEYKGKINR